MDALTYTGALTLTPAGANDFVLNEAAGSNFQVTASAPITVDQIAVTNASQGSVADGVDGLSVAFTQGNDGDGAETNAAINVAVVGDSTQADT